MSNIIMPSGKEGFARGLVAWDTDDIRLVLLTSGYTFDSAHDFLNDVGAGFRVATSTALAGKTATGGVLDATDYTFTALTGSAITQGFYYKHTGVEATARLLVYFDQAVGITFTPDGSNALFEHSNGADKIAAL